MAKIPTIKLKFKSKRIQTKGKLAYEYNPLFNYRTQYENSDTEFHNDGTLTDLITTGSDQLNFNLEHPVDIQCQDSYDGSVNLILNDGYNLPRLINTRFTALENNTYERRDRYGNTDTNIYDKSEFEIDTSLVKRYKNIPKVKFDGVFMGGELYVGNYVFYFKLSDADGNETDVVAESGLVTLHIGSLNSPTTIRGGLYNENSNKMVQFRLINIDSGYDYVTVYYTRTTGTDNKPRTTTATKILNKYRIRSGVCSINITGHEQKQDISVNEINQDFFIANKAKTQAICLNMLIMGNVSKDTPDYNEFSKVSLGFVPAYRRTKYANEIGTLNENYSPTNGCGYYDVKNIYNKVGYWNEEIYRFGIVYIMSNGSLSPVYSIRGINEVPLYENTPSAANTIASSYTNWNDLNVDYDTLFINKLTLENSAGICRINDISINNNDEDNYFYIRNYIFIPQNGVYDKLKELKVKGYFFVRQKRIPTILGLAFVICKDTYSGIPAWKLLDNANSNKEYYVTEGFLDGSGVLSNGYNERLIPLDPTVIDNSVAICPEYELNQPYYNNLFTGGQLPIRQLTDEYVLEGDYNHIYATKEYKKISGMMLNVHIQSVPEGALIRDKGNLFKAHAGNANDISFEKLCNGTVEPDVDNFLNDNDKYNCKFISGKINLSNYDKSVKVRIVRGIYGTYLGIYGNNNIEPNSLINIYISGYDAGLMLEYFKIRINCEDEFYPVTERFLLSTLNPNNSLNVALIYRGDCYISQFTHRINRNFQDPDAPNNELIVDPETWKSNYNIDEEGEKDDDLKLGSNVNRGDINAVKLGTYLTFRCYTSYNIAMRDTDSMFPAEEALTGSKRSFYPLSPLRIDGNYKISESCMYNQGFSATTGEKYHFLLPAVPYIKNTFLTRLIYSDIAQNDSFKNGFRIFKGISFRDYSSQHGGIMKIMECQRNLMIFFEHAIALVRVSEDVMLPTDDGTKIAVGAVKAISDTPQFISTTIGTQWPDSICKSDKYFYGIDTFAKKIWRVDFKGTLEIISDFKVLKFLNENITLSERELTPILGIRNVKTHYNRFKEDIMFTFYDNLYGFEEKAWNLCFNELTNTFVTFYSWIPSFSANIQNVFFSYDRNSSKWISKLAQTKKDNPIVSGTCLTELDITNWWKSTSSPYYRYLTLYFLNRPLPDSCKLVYTLERDNFGFYKYFLIWYSYYNGSTELTVPTSAHLTFDDTITCTNVKCRLRISESKYNDLLKFMFDRDPLYHCVQLNISTQILVTNNENNTIFDLQWSNFAEHNAGYYKSQIFITFNDIITSAGKIKTDIEHGLPEIEYTCPELVTDFWKHGYGGIFDVQGKIKPCNWYGRLHPFEFEFVIGSSSPEYKQFDNMMIVSNNVLPESVHYTIIGDSYNFADLKSNIYFRQEATKAFYQYNGADILYDHKVFDKITGYLPKKITSSDYIERAVDPNGSQGDYLRNRQTSVSTTYKDTLLPWIYTRQDTFNEIEDYYKQIISPLSKDYNNITGCEVYWDELLNQFSLCNHVKIRDIKKYGRMRGNIQYINDKMSLQISPIILYNSNITWYTDSNGNSYPKLILNNIPQQVYDHISSITSEEIPNELKSDGYYFHDNSGAEYTIDALDLTSWELMSRGRKEIKLMDKYMKTKFRYDGTELVMITAIGTVFNSDVKV